MLYVKGIPTIVKKAGIAISNLPQSISRSDEAMSTPTTIKAGAVTWLVTTVNNGEKNILKTNKIDTVSEVRPVFPPIAMPAEDST